MLKNKEITLAAPSEKHNKLTTIYALLGCGVNFCKTPKTSFHVPTNISSMIFCSLPHRFLLSNLPNMTNNRNDFYLHIYPNI